MSRFVDSLIAYRILKLLTTPFEETEAFRLGIIDSQGKELKKMSQLNKVDERDAYTILHRLVFRLKKIIEKVPIQNKKLVSYAAALSLIKEEYNTNKECIDLEIKFLNRLDSNLTEEIEFVEQYVTNKNTLTFKHFMEEIPANNAGTPGVAGFTPDSVGVSKKAQQKYKSKNLLFRRKKIEDSNGTDTYR